MIEYRKNLLDGNITVTLEGYIVGYIKKVPNGYQYFPKLKRKGGNVFPTLDELKRDLEF